MTTTSRSATMKPKRTYRRKSDKNFIEDNDVDINGYPPVRGEKLKIAARKRRDQEADLYKELANLLPYDTAVTRKLNNSDIMRLVVSYIQMKNYVLQGGSSSLDNLTRSITEGHKDGKKVLWADSEASLMLNTVDSFLIVVNLQHRVVFTSENVVDYLGYQQIEMIGQNVLDYISEDQQDFFVELLKEDVTQHTHKRSICNCNCDKKGHTCAEDCGEKILAVNRNFQISLRRRLTRKMRRRKESPYQSFHWSGRLQYILKHDLVDQDRDSDVKPYNTQLSGFIGLLRPVINMAPEEMPTVGSSFALKINFDLQLTGVDESIRHIMGFEPNDLINKSLWDLWHPDDATYRHSCAKSGCAFSCPGKQKAKKNCVLFRIRNKNDDWVWIESRIALASKEDRHLITICQVVSEERGNEFLEALSAPNRKITDDSPVSVKEVMKMKEECSKHLEKCASMSQQKTKKKQKTETIVTDPMPSSPQDETVVSDVSLAVKPHITKQMSTVESESHLDAETLDLYDMDTDEMHLMENELAVINELSGLSHDLLGEGGFTMEVDSGVNSTDQVVLSPQDSVSDVLSPVRYSLSQVGGDDVLHSMSVAADTSPLSVHVKDEYSELQYNVEVASTVTSNVSTDSVLDTSASIDTKTKSMSDLPVNITEMLDDLQRGLGTSAIFSTHSDGNIVSNITDASHTVNMLLPTSSEHSLVLTPEHTVHSPQYMVQSQTNNVLSPQYEALSPQHELYSPMRTAHSPQNGFQPSELMQSPSLPAQSSQVAQSAPQGAVSSQLSLASPQHSSPVMLGNKAVTIPMTAVSAVQNIPVKTVAVHKYPMSMPTRSATVTKDKACDEVCEAVCMYTAICKPDVDSVAKESPSILDQLLRSSDLSSVSLPKAKSTIPVPDYPMSGGLTDSDFEVAMNFIGSEPSTTVKVEDGRKSADLVDNLLSDLSTLRGQEALSFLDSMDGSSASISNNTTTQPLTADNTTALPLPVTSRQLVTTQSHQVHLHNSSQPNGIITSKIAAKGRNAGVTPRSNVTQGWSQGKTITQLLTSDIKPTGSFHNKGKLIKDSASITESSVLSTVQSNNNNVLPDNNVISTQATSLMSDSNVQNLLVNQLDEHSLNAVTLLSSDDLSRVQSQENVLSPLSSTMSPQSLVNYDDGSFMFMIDDALDLNGEPVTTEIDDRGKSRLSSRLSSDTSTCVTSEGLNSPEAFSLTDDIVGLDQLLNTVNDNTAGNDQFGTIASDQLFTVVNQ